MTLDGISAAKVLRVLLHAACIGAAALPPLAHAQKDGGSIEMLHVRGPIYMFAGDGGNVIASIGPDGILLVDTGAGAKTEQLMTKVRLREREALLRKRIWAPVGGTETKSAAQFLRAPLPPPKSVRYIINTSADPEHTGGNARIGTVPTEMSFESPLEMATHRFAYENVLLRMSGAEDGATARATEMWPSDTYVSDRYKMSSYFNGEGVELIHVPAAHSDGDSLVWFRGSDVICTGDIYLTTAYPIPNLQQGGSIQGIIEGLNDLIDLSEPEYRDEGGTLIVPGHGRLSDFGDLIAYRDMVTIIRDRVQHMVDAGMTLEQVEAARPSLEYDPRYAKQKGSSKKFIEAVYKSLVPNR